MTHDNKRFDSRRMQVLTGAERWSEWDPPRFLARLGLHAGQSVVDIGSGPGFWTQPLAEIVGPKGTVWALDASQEMLDALAARNLPAQVHLLRSELPKIDLPGHTIDLAWTAFVFHEVETPEELARELHRVVMPTGRVLVLDWRPDAESEKGPPRAHRLAPMQVMAWLNTAGFTRAEQIWQDADHYLIEGKVEQVYGEKESDRHRIP